MLCISTCIDFLDFEFLFSKAEELGLTGKKKKDCIQTLYSRLTSTHVWGRVKSVIKKGAKGWLGVSWCFHARKLNIDVFLYSSAHLLGGGEEKTNKQTTICLKCLVIFDNILQKIWPILKLSDVQHCKIICLADPWISSYSVSHDL